MIGFPTFFSNYAHRQIMQAEETNRHRKIKPKEEKMDGFQKFKKQTCGIPRAQQFAK